MNRNIETAGTLYAAQNNECMAKYLNYFMFAGACTWKGLRCRVGAAECLLVGVGGRESRVSVY